MTATGATAPPRTARANPPSDRLLIALLAAITASGPVAMNIYLPALPAVQTEFGVSVAHVSATLSASLVAFAIGLLFYGPVSDRYGRRPVLLTGLGVFALGNVVCLLAPTLGWLIAGRVLQSLGTSAGVTVARAVLGDLFAREKMARMLAYLTMVMVLGPTVSPLLGSALTEAFGWHAVFAFMLAFILPVAWAAWRFLPETRVPGLHASSGAQILGASLGLLRRPVFLGYAAQGGVVSATFLTFVSIAPYVIAAMGYPATTYGSWYLLLAGGYFIGNWSVTRLGTRLGVHRLIVLGSGLQSGGCAIGVVLALAGLWHPAAIFLPMLVVGIGQGMTLPNVTAAAVALAPGNAGAASSMLGFSQQMIGALSVQTMALFPAATPVPIYVFCASISALAFAAAMLMPQAEGPHGAD